MAFANVIDLDGLSAAISDDQPQGTDIRNDRSPTSDYYTIKDARNSARAAERSALFDDNDADLMAPWREVAKSAEKILTNIGKDLEVACWYTEALIRLYGFPGLRDGIMLIDRMIADYWETLYPEPDEDGLETKVAPLAGLNGDGADGTLLMPIRNAPITPDGDEGVFSFVHYQQARDADRIADDDARAARIEALGYSLGQFEQCADSASAQWAYDLIETLEQAVASYKRINDALRTSCAHDAPPSSNINALLDEVLRTARFVYKAKLESLASTVADAKSDSVADVTAIAQADTTVESMPVAAPAGAIVTREDALVLLEKAAKYFRTYEPHTPLAPGLERLIGWGRMTVSELMTELLPDEQSRAMYSQLTGVKLDGTDTQRYTAPPITSSAVAGASNNNETVEQSQEAASEDSGWDSKKEPAEPEVGW